MDDESGKGGGACHAVYIGCSGLGNILTAPMLKSRRSRNSTASNFPVVRASRKGISMIYRDVLYSYAVYNDRVTLTCARESWVSWSLCQLNLPQRKTKNREENRKPKLHPVQSSLAYIL